MPSASAGLKTNRRRKLHALKKDVRIMRHGLLLSNSTFEWFDDNADFFAVTCCDLRCTLLGMSVDLAGKRYDQYSLTHFLRFVYFTHAVHAAVRDAGATVFPDGSGVTIRGWTVQTVKAPILSTSLSLVRHVDHPCFNS